MLKGGTSLLFCYGIRTYPLDTLAGMKFSAFRNRHAIRDFYDVCWFVTRKPEVVTSSLALLLWETLQYKGFDTLVDELKETSLEDHIMARVDAERLALEMLEKLPQLISDGKSESPD